MFGSPMSGHAFLHPAAVVTGGDFGIIVGENAVIYEYIKRGGEQIAEVDFPPGRHIVDAFDIDPLGDFKPLICADEKSGRVLVVFKRFRRRDNRAVTAPEDPRRVLLGYRRERDNNSNVRHSPAFLLASATPFLYCLIFLTAHSVSSPADRRSA